MSLRIANIKTDDKGTYECLASNHFHEDSTVFEFDVICMLTIFISTSTILITEDLFDIYNFIRKLELIQTLIIIIRV